MFKLKSNGHAEAYWNGKKMVPFTPDRYGTYETNNADEAAILLNCFGVSLVEEPKPVEAPKLEHTEIEVVAEVEAPKPAKAHKPRKAKAE